ncbi:hypothetical protein, partial [Pseudomonas aeruginosa]|uniref:hypothetical protein n=1 Tax=Pseudomonas aeruginosa TaxID=287 RepID=UPI0039E300A4
IKRHELNCQPTFHENIWNLNSAIRKRPLRLRKGALGRYGDYRATFPEGIAMATVQAAASNGMRELAVP